MAWLGIETGSLRERSDLRIRVDVALELKMGMHDLALLACRWAVLISTTTTPAEW